MDPLSSQTHKRDQLTTGLAGECDYTLILDHSKHRELHPIAALAGLDHHKPPTASCVAALTTSRAPFKLISLRNGTARLLPLESIDAQSSMILKSHALVMFAGKQKLTMLETNMKRGWQKPDRQTASFLPGQVYQPQPAASLSRLRQQRSQVIA